MKAASERAAVRIARVDADRNGQRLDNFLAAQLKGVPRAAVYRMIRTGQVRVNGKRAKPATRLEEGDEVRIPPARVREGEPAEVGEPVRARLRGAILHEDDDCLVVDKPSGMAVHAGSGLSWGIIEALRQDRPGEFLELAHRLDRETSGCLLLARSGPALQHFSSQFRDGRVDKRYLCLLDGRLTEDVVEVDAPLARTPGDSRESVQVSEDGKAARTRFRLLRRYADCSYAEAELFTGRTHQIRVHARHLGLPLAGDDRYGGRESLKRWKKRGLRRLFLHAHRVSLEAPGGTSIDVHSPLPQDLREVLDRLG